MTILPSRSRRLAGRRVWAMHTLRLHVEDGGVCGFCASTYGATTPWPCLPARTAQLYVGPPQSAHAGRFRPGRSS